MTDRPGPHLEAQSFPADYHDYVFKDGKLVGDFDNMYRHSSGVPWDQDERCNQWYAEAGLLMLRQRAPFASILEIGCGLGFITAKLRDLAPPLSVDACDVSAEAIERARAMHMGLRFWVDDITREDFQVDRRYALVVVRDVFWYICHKMSTVVRNIDRAVEDGGSLYLAQSFPALDRPYVGKDVLPNPEALLRYFDRYRPVSSALLRNHELANDGPILHFLGSKS